MFFPTLDRSTRGTRHARQKGPKKKKIYRRFVIVTVSRGLRAFFVFFFFVWSDRREESIAHLLVQIQSERSKWTCKHRGKQRLSRQGCRENSSANVYDRLPSFSCGVCGNKEEKLRYDSEPSQQDAALCLKRQTVKLDIKLDFDLDFLFCTQAHR